MKLPFLLIASLCISIIGCHKTDPRLTSTKTNVAIKRVSDDSGGYMLSISIPTFGIDEKIIGANLSGWGKELKRDSARSLHEHAISEGYTFVTTGPEKISQNEWLLHIYYNNPNRQMDINFGKVKGTATLNGQKINQSMPIINAKVYGFRLKYTDDDSLIVGSVSYP